MRFRKSLVSCFTTLALSNGFVPASAGTNEYNAAIGRGDYKAAAAETISIWESIDKTESYAPSMAREFAFANYMAGNFDSARAFIEQLTGSDSVLSVNDNQPLVSRLLSSLIIYNINKNEQQRDELLLNLKNRIELPGTDVISITASEYLFNNDWKDRNWSHAKESAALGIELLGRSRGGLIRKRNAEFIAGVSGFLDTQDKEDYYRLADLHNAIVSDLDVTENAKYSDYLINLRWLTMAWVDSIWAYFKSNYKQTGTRINTELERKSLKSSKGEELDKQSNSTGSKPYCDASISHPPIQYPNSGLYRGLVGTVIMKMDFDEEGNGSNPVVLAVIPDSSFSESILKTSAKFRLAPRNGQDRSNCRLNQKGRVLKFTFVIQ